MTKHPHAAASALDMPALEITEEAFQRAEEILYDFEEGRGIGLGELLVAIFLTVGAKLPSSVIVEDGARLLCERVEACG